MIFLIVVLAFVLRLVNLNQSLWLDEAINVVYARSSDFWWFVTSYPVGDFHPPGWFAILWVWGQLFGFSEIAVRGPSVILGTATVWLIYLLGKQLFSRKIGLFAALFLAIAPLHVYYSQEARMYVFTAFAATASFYFLHRLILQKKLAGLGYILSLILIFYSDYLAYLVVPAQLFYLFLEKNLMKNLKFFLVSFLAVIPWFLIFPRQLQTGLNAASSLPGWYGVVGSTFKDIILIPLKTFFGRVSFADKNLFILTSFFIGIVYAFIFSFGIKKINQSKLLICWILIPLILAFLISFFIPVLAYFRMIFILPAVYLLLAKGIDNLPKKIAAPLFILICLVSVLSLMHYFLNPKFQRENWKEALSFVSSNLDDQSIVIFENTELPAPVRYYVSDLKDFKPGISSDLERNLIDKRKVWLFEYLVDVYDPKREVEKRLQSLEFKQTKVYDFTGVGFVKLYEIF